MLEKPAQSLLCVDHGGKAENIAAMFHEKIKNEVFF